MQANPAAAQLLGCSFDELIGLNVGPGARQHPATP